MKVPTSLEELMEEGVIECPECHQLLDATDINNLERHLREQHPVELAKIQEELFFDALCESGLLTKI